MRARRSSEIGKVVGRWIVVAGLLVAGPLSGHAALELAEGPGGSVEIVIDGVAVGIPASVVEAVEAAVAEHGNDPDGLAAAMEALVVAASCNTAAACERLAAAVVSLAVSKSNQQADIVGAIVQGVAAAVPTAKADTLLAAVGAAQEPRGDLAGTAQATAQPPRSASPIE